jgi:hypothetical protein
VREKIWGFIPTERKCGGEWSEMIDFVLRGPKQIVFMGAGFSGVDMRDAWIGCVMMRLVGS